LRIKKIECFKVNLHLKYKFDISHFSRSFSQSVFVKIELDSGDVGWGESLPREYVTGETQDSVVSVLKKKYIPLISKWDVNNFDEVVLRLKKLNTKKETNCALCAIELATLDAYGKYFKKSISELFTKPKKNKIYYSAVISKDAGILKMLRIRLFGFKNVKVKVGFGDDIKRLSLSKLIFGKKIEISVDANSAWDVNTAIDKIKQFQKFNVISVEQPVKTINELNQVAKQSIIPLVADESLCTIEDAKSLNNVFFDIRISKCGGLLKSLEIYEYAKKNGIKCILGCHVGESGILSAAGRHFGCGTDMLYYEGSYGTFLLKKDVTKSDLTFGHEGIGNKLEGFGLGVDVDEEKIISFIEPTNK
jgi:muconate cycloisomerase